MDDTAVLSMDTLAKVAAEMSRAVDKHGFDNTPLSPFLPKTQKLSVLVEEVGEVAHELNEHYLLGQDRNHATEHLEAELVQVAAVSLMWIESLRERKEAGHV